MLALNATLDERDAFGRARLRSLLRYATVFIAHAQEKPAGLCIVVKRGPSVHAIAVQPEFRRCGLGSALLRAAMNLFGKLRCQIRASNVASERLFRNAGFKLSRMRPNVYADGEAALEFRL